MTSGASPDPLDRLRRVADRLPEPVRRRGRAAVRRLRAPRPETSVVVLLHGDEQTAAATLDSARAQQVPRLEIVVVAMQDHLEALAERAEAEDRRVQVAPMLGEDWAAARRFGAVAARGQWVLHLSSGQLLAPDALRTLLDARHGDRLVLGGLEGDPGPTEGGWARTPLLGRVLAPRGEWARVVDDAEPDGQGAAVTLLVHGHHAVPAVTLTEHRHPHGPEAVDQPVTDMADLVSARVAQDRSCLALLEGVDLHEARRQRAAGALARDLPPLLRTADRADDASWHLLVRHAEELLEAAGPLVVEVPVVDRVAAWLASRDRREVLASWWSQADGGRLGTEVVDGVVRAVLPEHLASDVAALGDDPDGATRLTELGPGESPLALELVRARVDDDALAVEVWAALRGVDDDGAATSTSPEARAWWQGPAVLEVPVDVTADPAVTRWAGEARARHDRGVLRFEVGLGELSTGDWRLRVELAHRGVVRAGLVSSMDPHGSAARAIVADGRRFAFEPAADGSLLLRVTDAPDDASLRPAGVLVTAAELEPDRVVLELDAPDDAEVLLEGLDERAVGHVVHGRRVDATRWEVDLVCDPDGTGPRPAPTGTYRLVLRSGGTDLLASPADAVVDRLPCSELDALRRTSLWGDPQGGLLVRVDPDLGDDEAGPWAQQRLVDELLARRGGTEDGLVLLEHDEGEPPTGPVGEVLDALRADLPPGTRLVVAVADASVRVPDGAGAVLRRSWEWYDALGRAAHLVLDREPPAWFEAREDQEVHVVRDGGAAEVVARLRERLGGAASSAGPAGRPAPRAGTRPRGRGRS